MNTNFKKEVQLFMIFDILGDTERTGPHLWKINRFRLEDVKNHILDLLLITRILKKHLPTNLDYNKIYDYIICHDLPEAITGDITKFEGITEEEIKKVTNIAIEYLSNKFNNIIDFKTILNNYENRNDLESKIVHMIDKIHSSTTFIKYQSEQNIDMQNPNIIKELRNHPFVKEKISEGKDLADTFFEFHLKAVNITNEELIKYNIEREYANSITNIIKEFAIEFHNQKLNNTLFSIEKEFPKEAMIYNRNKSKNLHNNSI